MFLPIGIGTNFGYYDDPALAFVPAESLEPQTKRLELVERLATQS